MDPLSVGASVVGLIAAGARLIPQLYNLSSNIKDAPQQARAAVSELGDITIVLTQLQKYIDRRAQASIQRLNLITVEHIAASLTESVSPILSQLSTLQKRHIFGVPLQTSIRYANVAISLYNDEGQSYIYGYIPMVIAKCGVYLKELGTDAVGVFGMAGSPKRMGDLQLAFESPPRYGKGLEWTPNKVHDVANVLLRYLNELPEPIMQLSPYERFRDPLRSATPEQFEEDVAIKEYQSLLTELPPLFRQSLLYLLDLMALFASKSDVNSMTTFELAAIFQFAILRHPHHDRSPKEPRLYQDVLILLIHNQAEFLIGVQPN